MLQNLRTKMKNKKGFTLMEMLIVVAIIAILLAIAIPAFTNALNDSKVKADEANVRAWYAEQMAVLMTDNITTAPTFEADILQAPGATAVPYGDTASPIDPTTFGIQYKSTHKNTVTNFGSATSAPTP